MYTFGFIGAGNMGGTLAAAAAKSGLGIAVSDKSAEKAEELAKKTGALPTTNEDIAHNSEFIVLGVKPQMLKDVLTGISPIVKERSDRFCFITMAAGVSTELFCSYLGAEYPVIRIMPNTPAAIGEGLILCAKNGMVSDAEYDKFKSGFAAAGMLDDISESLIDAASAISGCGPAYVYMFIEALADGGVRCGLPRDKALKFAAKTVLGSAGMVLALGTHPGALKDAVCSPAGSTIEGVAALENAGFRAAAIEAVTAAYKRTEELGK